MLGHRRSLKNGLGEVSAEAATVDSQCMIVAGVDDSMASDWAVRWAAEEALLQGTGLFLARVVDPVTFSTPDRRISERSYRWQTHLARETLARARGVVVDRVGTPPQLQIFSEVAYGSVVSTLSALVPNASLIVAGSLARRSWGGRRLSSVCAGLCLQATGSVAVVHGEFAACRGGQRVVVGVDGTNASDAAIGLAFEEASRRRVALVAVHVCADDTTMPTSRHGRRRCQHTRGWTLDAHLTPWRRRHPDVDVVKRVVAGSPAHGLLAEGQGAGVVVVGSRGRGVFESLTLGSVATAVATESDAPVIVSRSP